jgi:thiosulfate reductase cytochrome b subunit
MVFAQPLIDVGVAILVAYALAEYCKFTRKAEKGFSWLALGGVWLLFAGIFPVAATIGSYVGASVWTGISQIFEVIGWIFALIGVLFVAYEVLVQK